jgi:hypothetical protein
MCIIVGLTVAFTLPAESAAQMPAGRFTPVAVYVDSGAAPLAAYQVEITAPGAEIAGVEGGEAAAFRAAPYYDPAALRGGRIVLAAFDTGKDLPRGRTRVATLHMYEPGSTAPAYETTLIVAASTDGEPIAASVTLSRSEGEHR